MRAGRSRWARRAAEHACLALVPAGTGGDQALEPEPLVEARGGTGPPRMFRGLKGALAFDILLIFALKVPCATRAMQYTTTVWPARYTAHRSARCDQPSTSLARLLPQPTD